MHGHRTSRLTKNDPVRQSEAESRQRGRLLLLARIACIVVDVLVLGLFVVTLPTYFAQLHQPCTTAFCSYGQLSPSGVQALGTVGLSIAGYAALVVTLVIAQALLYVVVAALLLWRKSDNGMALLVSVMLLILGATFTTVDASVLRPVLGALLAVPVANLFGYLGAVALPLIFSLFPTGRFVPRWTGWLVLAMLIVGVIFIFSPPPSSDASLISSFFWGSCILVLAGTQIYRYRRVSTPVERQQTKWVIFGFTMAILLTMGLYLPKVFFPSLRQADSPYTTFVELVGTFTLSLPITLSFGLAILRYHLYDIDVIINRTLVYGTLTGLLALVYFGLISGLQLFLRGLIHQDSTITIVVSTLVIAALFHPLRRRLQDIIDRRFYRRKYDVAKTLEAYSATLRNEVDLNQLSERLVAVVQQTKQPSHVSLWLRPPEPSRKRKTWLLVRMNEEESK
jgi:hypothetical protein